MADGDTFTELGTKLKLATGRPATHDQAGYGALSFTEIKGVISLPDRGDTSADTSEPTLADGRVEHFGGAKDGGVLDIPIKHIEGDAGQTALLAGAGTNGTFSFQEVDPDGDAHFYFARILDVKRRAATASSFKGYVARVAVNSGRFTGTEV